MLDSPPVLAVTDASILASHADGTVMVVEPGRSRSEAFQRALQTLGQANTKVLGAVLNKVKSHRRGYYYYRYYHRGQAVDVEARATDGDSQLASSPPARAD